MPTLSFSLLLIASTAALANVSPKPLALPIHRRKVSVRTLVERSGPESVTIVNNVGNSNTVHLYAVNISVGSPPQSIEVNIDTGSSDLWMFSPAGCTDVQCIGGSFDQQQSSTFQAVQGIRKFQTRYAKAKSFVQGIYFKDDFALGDIKLSNNIMGLAESATSVLQGIFGIGFPVNEAIHYQTKGRFKYNNTVIQMKNQGIIPSFSYSLYMDDLSSSTLQTWHSSSATDFNTATVAATGTILFGGYDTKKYVANSMTVLDVLLDPHTSLPNGLAVPWSYLGVSDSTGTTLVAGGQFPLPAVLDTGTHLTLVPAEVLSPIVDYFGAYYDPEAARYLVSCDVASWEGTLDYGFGDGAGVVQVPFAEIAFSVDNDFQTPSGEKACAFGFSPSSNDRVTLGDTFLRSAYVIYDLGAFQIAIGQAVFNESDSDIQSIPFGISIASILDSTAEVATTVTAAPTHSYSDASINVPTEPVSNTAQISGVKTSLALATTLASETTPGWTTGIASSTTTSEAGSAPTGRVDVTKIVVTGGSLLGILMFSLV